MDAARREAIEETGVKIEPLGVPLCQRVTLNFSNLVFQRWHLLVVAETETSVLEPRDGEEIAEARLFDTLPHVDDEEMMSWMHELHRAGTKYLRSLEVLDGI